MDRAIKRAFCLLTPIEGVLLLQVGLDRLGGPGAGLHRHGGFLHDEAVAGQMLRDRAGDMFHVRQIRLAGRLLRRAHRDEDDRRLGHGVFH